MSAMSETIVRRVRAEYLEMPGLHLTALQAARLWSLEQPVCDAVIARLVDDAFLRLTPTGTFARTSVGLTNQHAHGGRS
jgi:hypothetical protein